MKAVVTGGSGFLGRRLIALLQEQGHQVHSVGRTRSPVLDAAGVPSLEADLLDVPALSQAFQGAQVVFHVAAKASVWGAREEFHRANVLGTRGVLQACQRAGVTRLVHTSTPSVAFAGPVEGQDESAAPPRRLLSDYAITKAQAEREVLAANGPTLATVALRPHAIIGPGDRHIVPRVVEAARAGRLRQIGDGQNRVDLTYVDTAALAHLQAAQALGPGAACSGKAYFISQGEPVLLWEWIGKLLARLQLPPPGRAVPYAVAHALGALLEARHRLFRLGGEPRMTRYTAALLGQSHWFDIAAARRDFGFRPALTLSEGLERTLSDLGSSA